MVVNRLLKGGAKVSLTKPEAGGVPVRDRHGEARCVEQGGRRVRSAHRRPRRPPRRHARHHAQRAARRHLPVLRPLDGRGLDPLGARSLPVRLHHAAQRGQSRPATCAAVSTRSSCPTSAPTRSSTASITRRSSKSIAAALGDAGWQKPAPVRRRWRHPDRTRRSHPTCWSTRLPLGVKDLKRTYHARRALRPRRHRQPAGGHGAPRSAAAWRRETLRLLHQLAVFPTDGGLRLAESRAWWRAIRTPGERLAVGYAAKT